MPKATIFKNTSPNRNRGRQRVVGNSRSNNPDEQITQNALIEAKLKLDQMNPHAKLDIQRYQDKILLVDKRLDRILKDKLNKGKEYKQVKEEYVQVISKKKALQQTFFYIIDAYDTSLQEMASL